MSYRVVNSVSVLQSLLKLKGLFNFFATHLIPGMNIILTALRQNRREIWRLTLKQTTGLNASLHVRMQGCNKFKETQYKILHRQHKTPYILNKFDSSRSPLCQKCKRETGTYIHCLWQCPIIPEFWSSVTKELNLILETRIEKTPGLFLLNLPDNLRICLLILLINTSYYLLLKKLGFFWPENVYFLIGLWIIPLQFLMVQGNI